MAITGSGLQSMRSIPTFGTIGAIAEVVDNSIQWKDSNKDVEINIIFIEKNNSLEDIIISDNGRGMGLDGRGREIIDYCLIFGGGTNFGATSGLGKYGIGLPYACCSQSTNYNVYSWQDPKKIKHKYRNHSDFNHDDPVIDKDMEILTSFPKYFVNYIPNLNTYLSGTIVHWKNCDKLTYKKAVTLINHIEHRLGRIYRHYLGNGVKIFFKTYSQPNNGTPIKEDSLCRELRKVDPLFLELGTAAPPPYNNLPSSEAFGNLDTVVFTDSKGIEHKFEIRASLAKKDIQLPNCQPGGNTVIGKYYGNVQGISLVRANRELRLHHFDFPFPNGNHDQRHRWWKIEVKFEPISDEILDVNANKTDALHFRFISDQNQENDDADYIKLRYLLSSKVNNLIKELWKEILSRVEECKSKPLKTQTCPYCHNETLINGKCTSCEETVDFCQEIGHESVKLIKGICPVCAQVETPQNYCTKHNLAIDPGGICQKCKEEQIEENPLTEEEIDELVNILKVYNEFNATDRITLESLINWFANSNKRHFVIFISNPNNPSQFFEIATIPGKFDVILVNKNHPYYITHIGPIRDLVKSGIQLSDPSINYDFKEALDSLILFIITWVSTEKGATSDQTQIQRFRSRFGINLEEIITNWRY
jgi:hypothetical protein